MSYPEATSCAAGVSRTATRLLNLAGITALLVWMSCGLISLRFRMAWKAQKRSLADLPFIQPFYPVLPIAVLVLGTLMFIAQGKIHTIFASLRLFNAYAQGMQL